MATWTAQVAFDDGEPPLEDLHLYCSRESLQQDFSQFSKLRHLAVINVACVPLYLTAGPSLDVWTSNARTKTWLADHVLQEEEDEYTVELQRQWIRAGKESTFGVLLKVENTSENIADSGPEITEILIYSAIPAFRGKDHNVPPTPPASSSPQQNRDPKPHDGQSPKPRLYALPLSSKIFTHLDRIQHLVPVADSATPSAFFLPTSSPEPSILAAPRKRQKLETLFSDATLNRRQQKKKGGHGVSEAMANPIAALPRPPEPSFVRPSASQAQRGTLSRAVTTGSIQTRKSQSRPVSRRGTLVSSRKPSLQRAESILSVTTASTPIPEDAGANGAEAANKTALSRIVMAGMRMYGLQQRSKKSLNSTNGPANHPVLGDSEGMNRRDSSLGIPNGEKEGEEEEYKLVYHHTFKAAAFALRGRMRREVVGQEAMRDIVDRMLEIFCGE